MHVRYLKVPCTVRTEDEMVAVGQRGDRGSLVAPDRPVSVRSIKVNTVGINAIRTYNHRKVNADLLQAIHEGNEAIFNKCLVQGANPNTKCRSRGFHALHLAISMNSENIVLKLLEKKAKPDVLDTLGLTALHYAAWYNKPKILQRILEVSDVDMNLLINYKSVDPTPRRIKPDELELDSVYHKCESFDVKMPSGVWPNTSALHIACQKASWDCVQLLLDHGANQQTLDERGLTPLHVVGERVTTFDLHTKESFEKTVARLSEDSDGYMPLQPCNNNYKTPLHVAVILRSYVALEQLMELHFDRTLWDPDGETPIHLAIKNKSLESLQILIGNKTEDDISEIKNAKKFSPFQTVVEMEWMPAVEPLLDSNANILEVAQDGTTILHLLARNGNIELLKMFYENQLDEILDNVDDQNETPLICAIFSKNQECVEFFLRRGADVTVKKEGNLNVLHCAVIAGSATILVLLLECVKKKNRDLIDDTDDEHGMTPLHMAAEANKGECVKVLVGESDLEKGVALPETGGTPLHLAASGDCYESLFTMLEFIDANYVEWKDLQIVNSTDDEGRTPLHCAAMHSHRRCIELLLNNGGDLSASSYKDTSVLEVILKTVPRPTDFIQSILDKYIIISNEKPVTDPKCEVAIDFRIFVDQKKGHFKQMPVISNLFSTCHTLRHTQLLFHPLVEYFLYLKWIKLRKFFAIFFMLYMIYIFVLMWYILSVYYNNGERYYLVSNPKTLKYVLFVSLMTITIPEFLLYLDRRKDYTFTLDKTLKWCSIVLVIVIIFLPGPKEPNTWKHHLATVTVLVSTVKALFLLANLPDWGHYLQMFLKVSKNIIKVMVMFCFLIMGFTISFMIEFQNKQPFSGPFKAFVKTIAMMASELDFSGLFHAMDDESFDTIPTMLLFLLFIVFATIAAMNLMIGLAVSDIHSLETIGRIQRHMQQIEFLSILESSTLSKILPRRIKNWMSRLKKVDTKLTIETTTQLPQHIKENIMDIADKNSKQEHVATLKDVMEKLDMLLKLVQHK